MAIPKITDAEFVLSAPTAKSLPPPTLPEAAFVGRSNVGKSSLINTLLNRKNLVRTSSRPGCTQAVNFFLVNQRWYFVDLPGYGYAKAPLAVKAQWLKLMDGYLRERPSLRAVALLLDGRRTPGPEELELWAMLRGQGRRVIGVLTKADKLKRGERARRLQEITAALTPLGVTGAELTWFSSLSREGRQELWTRLLAALTD